MNADVCYQEIYYRFSQIYSNPFNELVINADSFKQVFKMMYSSEFLHVIPVLMFMTATVIFLYEREKLYDLSWLFGDWRLMSSLCKASDNN